MLLIPFIKTVHFKTEGKYTAEVRHGNCIANSPHLRGHNASKSSGNLLGVGTGPRDVNRHTYQLPEVIVSHLIYNDHLDGRFDRIHSLERLNGRHAAAVVHVVAERPYEWVHPLDVVEAVRDLVGVRQGAIDLRTTRWTLGSLHIFGSDGC
jgi:hypothetical protein